MRKSITAAVAAMIGCGSGGGGAPVVPGAMLAEAGAPAATTACYQGVSSGGGQQVRKLVRRVVDPAARQIVEDIVQDDAAGGLKRFHVVMVVDGARFTMTESSSGATGTGTLVGEPWRWTAWTSVSQRAADAGLAIESRDELTPTGKTAHKQIRKAGAPVGTIDDELTTIDCAGWAAAEAQLAVPVLDDALCDRACRRFATLRFAAAAEAEIAALPAATRDEARRKQAAALAARLDAGAPACIQQCRSANNAAQTACIARAASVDQLAACE